MTINIMCKYIIAAILLCDTVGVMSAANACSPPIANCSCVDGTLSCMHLTELPADIPSNITEFMFEECRLGQLTHIPYTKAEVLFIRNSGLTDISDGVLQNLVSLKTLDLTGNRLVSLRKEMFLGLRSLTDLSLRYNGIKHVADDAFENLPNLIEINLSENSGLHISDNVLSKNKELKHIMLRRCDLKNIPINALSKAQALTTLELEHNPLGSIPTNTFTKLNKLQTLNLFGCSLTAIPVGTFNGLKSLVTLNLGENNITEIPDSVFDDSRTTLQNLYLNDNKLKSLTGGESGDDIISWQNLHELKLGGNPWTCDCNLKWMRALDKSRIDDGKIICAEPESMMGRHVTLVMENEDNVSCPSEGGSSAIALGIAIPIIIICLLLIAFFIYKIMQTRRQRAGKKSVRYSEVYKDTVETTPKEGTQPLSVL